MVSNFECSNLKCEYTTGRSDSLKMRDLNEVVAKDGGIVKGRYTSCPKCKGNTLVYVSQTT